MYGSWSGVGGELGEGVGLDIKIDGDSHKKKNLIIIIIIK